MTRNEKCVENLLSRDVYCYIDNDTVYVTMFSSLSLELSGFEINYRAKLYDEELAEESKED